MIEKHKTKNMSKGLLEDIQTFHASLLQYTSVESTLYVFMFSQWNSCLPSEKLSHKTFVLTGISLNPNKAQQVFCCLLLGSCFGHQGFQAISEVGNWKLKRGPNIQFLPQRAIRCLIFWHGTGENMRLSQQRIQLYTKCPSWCSDHLQFKSDVAYRVRKQKLKFHN